MLRWSVHPSAEATATAAARLIAEAVQHNAGQRGSSTIAMSGGSNAQLLTALGAETLPWTDLTIYQVDERVAALTSGDRNLVTLTETLPAQAEIRAMPVDDINLEDAADRYADSLPDAFDVIQLGIGDDGHTASLVPDDPVLEVVDRKVAITQPYRGLRRMTLTFPVLERARFVVWVATGSAKRGPLEQLRNGDPTIPAGRVHAANQVVVCDAQAAPAGLP